MFWHWPGRNSWIPYPVPASLIRCVTDKTPGGPQVALPARALDPHAGRSNRAATWGHVIHSERANRRAGWPVAAAGLLKVTLRMVLSKRGGGGGEREARAQPVDTSRPLGRWPLCRRIKTRRATMGQDTSRRWLHATCACACASTLVGICYKDIQMRPLVCWCGAKIAYSARKKGCSLPNAQCAPPSRPPGVRQRDIFYVSNAELGTWGIFEIFLPIKNDFIAFFIKLITYFCTSPI